MSTSSSVSISLIIYIYSYFNEFYFKRLAHTVVVGVGVGVGGKASPKSVAWASRLETQAGAGTSVLVLKFVGRVGRLDTQGFWVTVWRRHLSSAPEASVFFCQLFR